MNEPLPRTGTHLIPFGGVGEFGANATLIESGETCILIDCGLMFPPDRRQPGVEFYVNDPHLMLRQFPNLSAVFLTHAHEDHIGGLGFLLEQRQMPVFTMPYTARLVKRALEYHKIDGDIREVSLGKAVTWGDISVTFIGVTHSIVQACALAIHTEDGTIVHSGDFKVDPLPGDDHPFQSEVFQALGEEGVDLLVMDSTNATRQGFCPSEHEIMPNLERAIAEASGRVFLTTFSSHMPRIRKLVDIAARCGRKIAFVGRSFRKHFQVCLETEYLGARESMFIEEGEAADKPDDAVLYVVSGSQGEQRSALSMIARTGYRGLQFRAGDRLIFSSRSIPGNERQVALLASELERNGVDVITAKGLPVHTSGHGYREDLAYLLALTRPRYVAPIHGEFHNLLSHHQWLRRLINEDQEVLLLEDGDVVAIDNGMIRNTQRVEVGMVPIDGNQNLPVSPRVLKERKDMMYSGLAVVCVVQDEAGFQFQVQTHGVCELEEGHIANMVARELESLTLPDDIDVAAEEIFRKARTAMKRVVCGKPLVKLIIDGKIIK